MIGALTRLLGAPLVPRPAWEGRGEAVVVLGAPLRPDGSLTPVLEERIAAGVALLREGLAPLIVFAGGRSPRAQHEGSEAAAMARRAAELGAPRSAMLLDEESKNTEENARNARRLLGDEVRRVFVVTTPFHLRRACRWFRREGFEPSAVKIERSVQYENGMKGLKWVAREYLALARDTKRR